MPDPNAVTVAVASAVLLLIVAVALAAVFRHRDPVGRAVAGHADMLGALRDTAIRSAKAPASATYRSYPDRADPAEEGVHLVPSGTNKAPPPEAVG
jgi:hypothetical protein